MSGIVYHSTGTALRDAFVYLTSAGAFQTGKVQADFTIQLSKNGVGNQSTAGITITEVSAVNNPGEYTIAATAVAFPASAGVYTLKIFDTATPVYCWEQVYVVGSNLTVMGPTASFTATVGDGRVTDGASAIDGATVYITNGSTFVTQTVTAGGGLWGPVYLTTGTYNARVQANGYTQGSASIVVSGLSVTGPGADIALTTGVTTNPLSAAQLWAYARRQAMDLTGTKADAIIKGAVNDALDMVSCQRLWPHLLRRAYLTLHGNYSTGTITITNGSSNVVLTTGTWPSWAANGKILVSGQILDVYTRTNDSTVTLDAAWGAATITDASYVLYQNEYDLPDDMWRFHAPLPGQRWGWGSAPVSPMEVLAAENAAVYGQQFPSIHAVVNGGIMVFPYPTADAVLAYTYYARPARLSVDTDIADWDPVHLEALKRAIDYQLACQVGKIVAGDKDSTKASFDECLARMSSQDKQPTSIQAVGSDWGWTRDRSLDWKRRQ